MPDLPERMLAVFELLHHPAFAILSPKNKRLQNGSSLNVCIVKTYILYFVVTPGNFIIAKYSIGKPGSSSVLIISVGSCNSLSTREKKHKLQSHISVDRFYFFLTVEKFSHNPH